MKYFRDFLREEFKDKKFESQFYKDMEKARIALEINFYREKAGLSQAELAERINSSQSAVARLENPEYKGYSIRVLRKIAEVLDLELFVSLRDKVQETELVDWRLRPIKLVQTNMFIEGEGNEFTPAA